MHLVYGYRSPYTIIYKKKQKVINMKKIKLLAIGILLSAIAVAQTPYKVLQASSIKWDGYNWNKIKKNFPENMYIVIDGSTISINNDSKSKFFTYGEVEEKKYNTHTSYSWSAIDSKADDCTIIMKMPVSNEDEKSILVIYKDGLIGLEFIIN